MVSLQKEKEIQHTSGGFLTCLAVYRGVCSIFCQFLQVRTEWRKKQFTSGFVLYFFGFDSLL